LYLPSFGQIPPVAVEWVVPDATDLRRSDIPQEVTINTTGPSWCKIRFIASGPKEDSHGGDAQKLNAGGGPRQLPARSPPAHLGPRSS